MSRIATKFSVLYTITYKHIQIQLHYKMISLRVWEDGGVLVMWLTCSCIASNYGKHHQTIHWVSQANIALQRFLGLVNEMTILIRAMPLQQVHFRYQFHQPRLVSKTGQPILIPLCNSRALFQRCSPLCRGLRIVTISFFFLFFLTDPIFFPYNCSKSRSNCTNLLATAYRSQFLHSARWRLQRWQWPRPAIHLPPTTSTIYT